MLYCLNDGGYVVRDDTDPVNLNQQGSTQDCGSQVKILVRKVKLAVYRLLIPFLLRKSGLNQAKKKRAFFSL